MVPEFVDRIGGSKWVQAQPARPTIRRETCGFEEISRFNLWRLVSCAVRRQQVEAGTARVGRADMRFPWDSGKPENSGT